MSDTRKQNKPSRILIIWDEIDIVNLFLHVFKTPEYVIETATNLNDGVAIIKNDPPDLLIIPRRGERENDGFEFCQQLRINSEIPRFPVIVGWADELDLSPRECIQQVFEIGANACFGRVFDISDIVPLVNMLLEDPSLNKLADRQTMNFAQ